MESMEMHGLLQKNVIAQMFLFHGSGDLSFSCVSCKYQLGLRLFL